MAALSSFDPAFQIRLPLPLARLYARSHHAKGERERHDYAIHLVEAGLKLAASALVTRYRSRGRRSAGVEAALRHLALPSLGQWVSILREALHFLAGPEGDDPWARKILERLGSRERSESLEGIFESLSRTIHYAGRRSARPSALDLLDLLPAYRNSMSDAHGSIKADPAAYRQTAPALLSLARVLLEEEAILGGGRLAYAEEVKVGLHGEERVVWMDLTGPTAIRRQPLEGEPVSGDVLPGRLYLEIGGEEHLSLHPLVFYQSAEVLDQVFYLNRARGGRSGPQFLCYETGEFYLPGRDPLGDVLARDLRDLLSWVIQGEVDSGDLERMGGESRSDARARGEVSGEDARPAGKVLGDFEILGELGRGGMAVVYLARQRSLDRLVALKVLPPGLRDDPVALARFRQEVRALSRCDHKNVVKILSSGEAEGTCWYAMEYIEGSDLAAIGAALREIGSKGAEVLRESHFDRAASSADTKAAADRAAGLPAVEPAPKEPPEVPEGGRNIAFRLASVIGEAARGVQHIHSHGIIHRDLKPQNIMVTGEEHRPVVMDLGLAKLSGASRSLTMDKGRILGTLRYMPPEQLQRNLLEVDERADVYALGAVLYELACLRPLWDGDTEERLTTQILFEEPPHPQKANPKLPADLATIIAKAVRKDPRERYPSAAELAEDLDRFARGEAISAKPPTLGYLLGLFVRRHRAAVSAALLAVVLVLALLAGWMASLRSAWRSEKAARESVQEGWENERRALARAEALRLASASQAVLPSNPGLALLLAIESAKRQPGIRSGEALRAAFDELREERTLVHVSSVRQAAFSPDGKRVLTVLRNFPGACLWDAGTGRLEFILHGSINWALYSPEGTRILTWEDGKTARLWDARNGKPLRALKKKIEVAPTGIFSPDGLRMVLPGPGNSALVADVDSGKELAVLSGHTGPVRIAAFSPDGARIATASLDWTARIWEGSSGKELVRIERDRIEFLVFGPEGRILAIASPSGKSFWDSASGKELVQLRKSKLEEVAFSPDGLKTVSFPNTFFEDISVEIQDVANGNIVHRLKGHDGFIRSAAFSPDGRLLVTAAGDKARLWNLETGKELAALAGHRDSLYHASFSPDGRKVLTASNDGTARIWSVESVRESSSLRLVEKPQEETVKLREDGRSALIYSVSHAARVLSSETGKEIGSISPIDTSWAVFSPDDRRVLACSDGNRATIFNVATGSASAILKGHEDGINQTSFSPDGRRVLTASRDRTARIWDADTGKEIMTFQGDEQGQELPVMSPDGRRVLTVFGECAVWDLETGKKILSLKSPPITESGRPSFSPDGRKLIVFDGALRILDASTGEELLRLGGTELSIIDFVPSKDWKSFLTVSRDSAGSRWTIQLWDMETGREISSLEEKESCYAILSPDGKRALALPHGRLWNLESRSLISELEGSVHDAVFSPDGLKVHTVTEREIAVWDTGTGKKISSIGSGRGWGFPESEIRSIAFSSDCTKVLFNLRRNRATIRTFPSQDNPIELEGDPFEPEFSHGSPWIISKKSGDFHFWDSRTGKKLSILKTNKNPEAIEFWRNEFLWNINLSADGMRAATVADKESTTAIIWDVLSGEEIASLKGHSRPINSLSFSLDGARIITASGDTTARIWDARSGKEILALRGHEVSLGTARFSPDGRLVITGSSGEVVDLEGYNSYMTDRDLTARTWDASTGREIARLVHENPIRLALFSPDGLRALTVMEFHEGYGSHPAIRVWDPLTGKVLASWMSERPVDTAGFSPDSSRIFSISGDLSRISRQVQVRDVATGETLMDLRMEGGVSSAAFVPDGNAIAALSTRGVLRVWPIDPLPAALERKPRDLLPDELDFFEIGAPPEREAYRKRWNRALYARDLELCLEKLQGLQDRGARNHALALLGPLSEQVSGEGTDAEEEKILSLAFKAVEKTGRRDPEILGVLAEIRGRRKEIREAIPILEEAVKLPGAPRDLFQKLDGYRKALLPDLATCRSIDDSLDAPDPIIREGDTWRFFRGRSEPSPGLEWTERGFDDSSWESGSGGFGYGDDDDATVLRDMQGGYTAVYLRRSFALPDPVPSGNYVFSVRADDGFVAYLNRREIGRALAGKPGIRMAHDGLADQEAEEPLVPWDLEIDRSILKPGENLLALQGLNRSLESSDFSLIPVLRREPPPDDPTFRRRLEGLRRAAAGPGAAARAAYMEGRILQKLGSLEAAIAKFGEAISRDPGRPEPFLRIAESLRGKGDPVQAEKRLREGIRSVTGESEDLWDLWFTVSAVDLKRAPEEILQALPGSAGEGRGADIRWLLESLISSGAIRINCGGDDHRGQGGILWGRDRFYRSGFRHFGDFQGGATEPFTEPIQGTGNPILYQTERWFPREIALPTAYRIPLPPGSYRIALHFAEIFYKEPGRRVFDVSIEGKKVLEGYEPFAAGFATADVKRFETQVLDGALDILFIPKVESPKVSAIEVTSLK